MALSLTPLAAFMEALSIEKYVLIGNDICYMLESQKGRNLYSLKGLQFCMQRFVESCESQGLHVTVRVFEREFREQRRHGGCRYPHADDDKEPDQGCRHRGHGREARRAQCFDELDQSVHAGLPQPAPLDGRHDWASFARCMVEKDLTRSESA